MVYLFVLKELFKGTGSDRTLVFDPPPFLLTECA